MVKILRFAQVVRMVPFSVGQVHYDHVLLNI